MAVLSKTLLAAVSAAGPGAAVDLTVMSRSLTFQVIPSVADSVFRVTFEASLDNVNWFGVGQMTGPGIYSNDGDVIQYVRANVIQAPSAGSITVYGSYVSG